MGGRGATMSTVHIVIMYVLYHLSCRPIYRMKTSKWPLVWIAPHSTPSSGGSKPNSRRKPTFFSPYTLHDITHFFLSVFYNFPDCCHLLGRVCASVRVAPFHFCRCLWVVCYQSLSQINYFWLSVLTLSLSHYYIMADTCTCVHE